MKLNWTVHEQCFEDLKPVNVYQMCCRENKTLLSQWTLDRGQWSLSETLIFLNVSLYSDSIWNLIVIFTQYGILREQKGINQGKSKAF